MKRAARTVQSTGQGPKRRTARDDGPVQSGRPRQPRALCQARHGWDTGIASWTGLPCSSPRLCQETQATIALSSTAWNGWRAKPCKAWGAGDRARHQAWVQEGRLATMPP